MDWEQSYQDGEMRWDLGEAAPPLMELLETRSQAWKGARALVPGCGAGHDAHALAVAGLAVTGLDLAPTALEKAAARYGELITWMQGDFFDEQGAEQNEFDLLFEHTCFCAIDPRLREAYVDASARWLRPNGRLVAIFFLDPPAREDGIAGPPYPSTREEIHRLFTGLFEIVEEASPNRSHPDRVGREWVMEMVRKP